MGDLELGNRGSGPVGNDNLLLKVRTKEGSEMDLVMQKGGLVNDLKQEIIRRLELVDKNVRLIFSGKLLDPPSAPLNSFKLSNGSFVHAVITNSVAHSSVLQREEEAPPVRITVDLSNLRGFDVLMIPGPQRSALSVDEITMLRLYFQEELADYSEEHMTRQSHESDEDFMYRCETQWAASQGPNSEFRVNLYGRSLFGLPAVLTNNDSSANSLRHSFEHSNNNGIQGNQDPESGSMREFFYGFMLGFGLGFMMIFCIWDRNVSHKQKWGILAGIMLQIGLTAMQQGQGSNNANHTGELHQSESKENLGITMPGPPPVSVVDQSGR